MNTTKPDVDERTILDALEWHPCDMPGHDEGQAGCVPAEQGRWRVLVGHVIFAADSCTNMVPVVMCDSMVAFVNQQIDGMFTPPAPGHQVIAICAVCHKILKDRAELLVVIGEV